MRPHKGLFQLPKKTIRSFCFWPLGFASFYAKQPSRSTPLAWHRTAPPRPEKHTKTKPGSVAQCHPPISVPPSVLLCIWNLNIDTQNEPSNVAHPLLRPLLFQLPDNAPYNLIEDFRFLNLLAPLSPLPRTALIMLFMIIWQSVRLIAFQFLFLWRSDLAIIVSGKIGGKMGINWDKCYTISAPPLSLFSYAIYYC